MITPKKEFLEESLLNLEQLLAELRSLSHYNPPTAYLYKLSRQIHTIKGTAQTFGFETLAETAHLFENTLQTIIRDEVIDYHQSSQALEQGLIELVECCKEDHQLPISMKAFLPRSPRKKNPTAKPVVFLNQIPALFLERLSHSEIGKLEEALDQGNSFYVIKNHYDLRTFAEQFKTFHDFLNERGRIIAYVPYQYEENNLEKGFRIFFTTDLRSGELAGGLETFRGEIEFRYQPNVNFKPKLKKVFVYIARDSQKILIRLGKQAVFQTRITADYISPRNFAVIRDAITHLMHNAVDHGIEAPPQRLTASKPAAGKISVMVSEKAEKILVKMQDDGGGINPEKIRTDAIQAGLIKHQDSLTSDEISHLIFRHGFSTAAETTELSGRGVGLSAVKQMVEEIGGTVTVESRTGLKTSFLLVLPRE